MALIFRQINSTKSLRAELERRNISMFNSIREIEEFKRNYKSISEDILAQAHIMANTVQIVPVISDC